MNLQEFGFYVDNIQSSPNLSYPIFHFKAEFWQMYILRIFKPRLVQWHFYSTCKNIEEIGFEANLQQLLTQTFRNMKTKLKTANTSDINSQTVTFYFT